MVEFLMSKDETGIGLKSKKLKKLNVPTLSLKKKICLYLIKLEFVPKE